MKAFRFFIAATVVGFSAASALSAHPMTYQGTVLTVQPTKVQVKTVDEHSKKEADVWFVVTKDTKVIRGGKAVSYAEAKILAKERVGVIVDMDADTKNVAEELRLAAK